MQWEDARIFDHSTGLPCKLFRIPSPGNLMRVQLHVAVGHAHEEDPRWWEAAHMLEHMQAKFTSPSYPHGRENKKALHRAGWHSNASTSDTLTCYIMEGHYEHWRLALDMLLQSLVDFRMDTSMLASEQRAVQQELQTKLDSKWYQHDHAMKQLLYPGHPCAIHESHHSNNVPKLDEQLLLAFRQKHYTWQATSLHLAGNVPPEAVAFVRGCLLANASLSSTPLATSPAPQPAPNPPLSVLKKRCHLVTAPATSGVLLLVVWRLPNTHNFCTHRDGSVVLSRMLQRCLHEKLRMELGLVYSVTASPQLQTPTCPPLHAQGLGDGASMSELLVQTECRPSDTAQVLHAIGQCTSSPDLKLDSETGGAALQQLGLALHKESLNLLPSRFLDSYAPALTFGWPVISNTTRRQQLTSSQHASRLQGWLEEVAAVLRTPPLAILGCAANNKGDICLDAMDAVMKEAFAHH